MEIKTALLALATLLILPPASAGTLNFRLPAEPATLDWNLARSSHETYVVMNLMAGLMEEGPDLQPRAALAESWEVSPDGLTYTFTLRPGVKWSDGKPLRAADFEDSWFRLLEPKTHSSYASFLFEIQGAEAFHAGKLKDRSAVGIHALSDNRFQVKLRRRVDYFLHLPTFWVTFPIRSDLIRKYGAKWTEPGKLVTLGAYRLARWDHGQGLGLRRNPDYFGAFAPGAPDQVDIVIEPDDTRERGLFIAGKIDFLLNSTTEDLVAVRSQKGEAYARVVQFPYLATWYLGFNVRNGSLKQKELRRAIALSINLDKIPSVLQGGQVAAHDWLPAEMRTRAEGTAPSAGLTGGLFEARGALQQAGHPEGRLLPKFGLLMEDFDGAGALGKYIAQSAKEIGVNVEPRIAPPQDFQRLVREGQTALFVAHWGADVPDASDFFKLFLSNSSTNYTGWSSPEYDREVEHALAATDPAARQAAYLRAEEILLKKEVAILPLFHQRDTVLIGPRVDKLDLTPLNYLFLKDVTLK